MNRLGPLALAFVCAVAISCESSSDPATEDLPPPARDAGGSATAREACERFMEAACERLYACHAGEELDAIDGQLGFYDAASCARKYTPINCDAVEAAVQYTRTFRVDLDAADACIARSNTWTCGLVGYFLMDMLNMKTCGEAFAGNVPWGRGCKTSMECAGPNMRCVRATPGASWGACLGPHEAAEYVKVCDKPEDCATDFCLLFAPNVQGHAGVCTAICQTDWDCGPGAACIVSEEGGFCAALCDPEGPPCASDLVCTDTGFLSAEICFPQPCDAGCDNGSSWCVPRECGGHCGSCDSSVGKQCVDGHCVCPGPDEKRCEGRDVVWYDGCGRRGDHVESCEHGCQDGACGPCVPDCGEKVCGADGCGGVCGRCDERFVCLGGECVCEEEPTWTCPDDHRRLVLAGCGVELESVDCTYGCDPDLPDLECNRCPDTCTGVECGGDDGCGGKCRCSAGKVCHDGLCCAPACTGVECGGDDGCGGTCGCFVGKECHDGLCCAPARPICHEGDLWGVDGCDRLREIVEVCPVGCVDRRCVTQVVVEGGEAWIGCVEGSADSCAPDELPRHRVWLNAYAIDVYEVTAYDFWLCPDARCQSLVHGVDTVECGGLCTVRNGEKRDHPANGVDRAAASAYCASKGRRLCTEAEWEAAARGLCKVVDGDCSATAPIWPHGDDAPACEQAAAANGSDGACTPAGTKPVSHAAVWPSPHRAVNMAGNVAEWVADDYADDYSGASIDGSPLSLGEGARGIVRGGSFEDQDGNALRAAHREAVDPTTRSPNIGFRCCVSDCDDGDPCTLDVLDHVSRACTSVPHPEPEALCPDDGDPCTVTTCVSGQGCVSEPKAIACDDGDPCTVDRCVPETGECGHALATDVEGCEALPFGRRDCTGSECVLRCDSGRADCDGWSGNGCETDTASDPRSCGSCDAVCPDGEVCSKGECLPECEEGLTTCGGACVDLQSSALHCGACGSPCYSWVFANLIAVCEGGACALVDCPEGTANPDGLSATGCEAACEYVAGWDTSCDGVDDDCDGETDEDRPLTSLTAGSGNTVSHTADCNGCSSCGLDEGGGAGCAAGTCFVAACSYGTFDTNGDHSDGCEDDGNGAGGRVLWADEENGDDALGNGSETKPFATIARALEIAVSGDVIRVRGSVSQQAPVVIPEGADGVTIEGTPGSTMASNPNFGADVDAIIDIKADGVTLRGLAFDLSNADYGVRVSGDDVRVESIYSGWSPLHTRGLVYVKGTPEEPVTGFLLRGVDWFSSFSDQLFINKPDPALIRVEHAHGATVENVLIERVPAPSFFLDDLACAFPGAPTLALVLLDSCQHCVVRRLVALEVHGPEAYVGCPERPKTRNGSLFGVTARDSPYLMLQLIDLADLSSRTSTDLAAGSVVGINLERCDASAAMHVEMRGLESLGRCCAPDDGETATHLGVAGIRALDSAVLQIYGADLQSLLGQCFLSDAESCTNQAYDTTSVTGIRLEGLAPKIRGVRIHDVSGGAYGDGVGDADLAVDLTGVVLADPKRDIAAHAAISAIRLVRNSPGTVACASIGGDTEISLSHLSCFDVGGDGVRLRPGSADVAVRSSVFSYVQGAGVNAAAGVGASLDHSVLWPAGAAAAANATAGEDLVFADPRFAWPGGGDLSVLPGSPLVDTADPAADYCAEPEPNGCRANAGAFGATDAAASGEGAAHCACEQ